MKPTRYVADRPCVHGHKPVRYKSNHVCVECVMTRNARKRAADPRPTQVIRRRSYENNRERVAELGRLWLKANPEAAKARWLRRRARVQGAAGTHTGQDIRSMFLRQNGKCAALHCQTDLGVVGYHVDHKTPLSRGGSNWPRNLQLLCQPCNNSKGTKTISEWRPCK